MPKVIIDSFSNAYTLLSEKVEEWIRDSILLIPNAITAIIVFLVFLFYRKDYRKLNDKSFCEVLCK